MERKTGSPAAAMTPSPAFGPWPVSGRSRQRSKPSPNKRRRRPTESCGSASKIGPTSCTCAMSAKAWYAALSSPSRRATDSPPSSKPPTSSTPRAANAGRGTRRRRSIRPAHTGITSANASQAPRERHSNKPMPSSAAAAVIATSAARRWPAAGKASMKAGVSSNSPSSAAAAYRPKAIIGSPKPSRVTPSVSACASSAQCVFRAMHSSRPVPASSSARRARPTCPATASPTGSTRPSLARSCRTSASPADRPRASAKPMLCRIR